MSFLPSHRLAAFGLALGLAFTPGCKKNKGSENPDEAAAAASAAQVEAAVEEAKQKAKISQLVLQANKDLANGRYISASNLADEALAENPDNADAYAVLGAARWRAGDFEGSTEAYEKALAIDDKNFGAVLGYANNLQAMGKHVQAVEGPAALLEDDAEQVDPRLSMLWSYYAVCDAENAIKTVDEIFPRMGKNDPLLPLVQAYAAFMRPLEGKGPLCTVEGTTGTTSLDINLTYGLKYAGAVVGGEFAPAIFLETREEAVIDSQMVKTLGLKEVGKYTAPGTETEVAIVIVPEIKFGELSLVNVPATVQPLEAYADAVGGETPGVILGRQAMQAMGTITFDFPGRSLEVAKAAPAGVSEGEIELPMVMLSMHLLHAPVIPVRIEGSDHEFYAYLGFTYGSGLAVTKKHYLKSGHLPREVEEPDDPDAGLKMVYVDGFSLGDQTFQGTSGLVLVNEPPDPTLDLFVRNVGFEVGGHINLNLLRTWRVTFAMGEGRVYIKP
ncbi:MAG: hypothetical protein AB1Z98_23700 [Nannocystaceae bacterium]